MRQAEDPRRTSATSPAARTPPQIRADNGPQVIATLRNLAIGTLKFAGYPSIAACRHHSRDVTRTLVTLGLSPA